MDIDVLKEHARKIIDLEGFHLTVDTCRKVMEANLGKSLDNHRKEAREAMESAIKDILLERPSLIETLKQPELTAGVGKATGKGKGAEIFAKKKKHHHHHHKHHHSKKRSSSGTRAPRTKKAKEEDGPPKPKKNQTSYFIYVGLRRQDITAKLEAEGFK
eukprot:Sspe_Gene.6820::Locus_2292_Transcript_1_1_Confidence_1.000_Length_541::g.6820::m.6820